jgi:hypothetical protein
MAEGKHLMKICSILVSLLMALSTPVFSTGIERPSKIKAD